MFHCFSQEIRSPEEVNSNCVNYPTEQFASYADCDQEFVRRTLPRGFVPFWSVNNVSMASNTFSWENVPNSIIAQNYIGIAEQFYSQ